MRPYDAGNRRKNAGKFYFLSYLTLHSWLYRGGLRWHYAILEAFRRKGRKALEKGSLPAGRGEIAKALRWLIAIIEAYAEKTRKRWKKDWL